MAHFEVVNLFYFMGASYVQRGKKLLIISFFTDLNLAKCFQLVLKLARDTVISNRNESLDTVIRIHQEK